MNEIFPLLLQIEIYAFPSIGSLNQRDGLDEVINFNVIERN